MYHLSSSNQRALTPIPDLCLPLRLCSRRRCFTTLYPFRLLPTSLLESAAERKQTRLMNCTLLVAPVVSTLSPHRLLLLVNRDIRSLRASRCLHSPLSPLSSTLTLSPRCSCNLSVIPLKPNYNKFSNNNKCNNSKSNSNRSFRDNSSC